MGASRIILGTAQFGLAYGISNAGGQVMPSEIAQILALANYAGIGALDTAAAYGDSESVLGAIPEAASFRITTKTVPIRAEVLDEYELRLVIEGLRNSLARLQRRSVDTFLVHDANDLLASAGDRLWAILEKAKCDGIAAHIGVSIYDRRQLEGIIDRFPISVVQLPFNVLDQRLLVDGSIAELKKRGIAIQARSAFLQGLLLMSPKDIVARLPRATAAVERWRNECTSAGTHPLAAALTFVLAQPEIDHVVLGVHSRSHLAECLEALTHPVTLPWSKLGSDDLDIIDPRRWAA